MAKKLGVVPERSGGPLVLVVDDERGLRSGAVNILRSEGFRVIEAESGLEGIDRFLAERPDLVVVDYEMPGMDGEDVVRRLRELEGDAEIRRRTPVLLATAGMVPLAGRCSADAFLVKPYQRIAAMRAKPDEVTGPTEVELLTEIRDELRRGTPQEA